MESQNLCTACQNLDLEFFLGEERPDRTFANDSDSDSDSDDSFEMVTSLAHHSSFLDLERSAISGCELCTMILDRIKSLPDFQHPDPSVDSAIQLMKTFERCHRIAIQYRGTSLSIPVYSPILTGCDEHYGDPPSPVSPLESDATQTLAATWIQTCQTKHPQCNVESAKVPTRLIYVGSPQNPEVCLFDGADVLDAHRTIFKDRRYVTLSHCWGKISDEDQRSITTKANIAERREKIDASLLSKTFQDAIKITRDLGLGLLWIDSLCIIQDDLQDRYQECALMDDIFTSSFCTIAASDSVDGHGGCFVSMNIPKSTSCTFVCWSSDRTNSAEITVFQGFNEWHTSMNGPLQKRGWVLQERHLSPRILHYTKSRLLWECRLCHASADRPLMELKSNTAQRQGVVGLLRFLDEGTGELDHLIPQNKDSRSAFHAQWTKVVEDYSNRLLSFSTDKLPALSGLAKAFRRSTDFYIAGLWKSAFIEGLYWRPDIHANFMAEQESQASSVALKKTPDHYRTRICGLPTWSWATLASAITYPLSTPISSVELLSYSITLAGADDFGAIERASVKISGRTLSAFAVKIHGFKSSEEWCLENKPLNSMSFSHVDALTPLRPFNVLAGDFNASHTFRATFYVDVTDDIILPETTLKCLLTCHMDRWYFPEDPDIAGLVLLGTENNEWRRVGTFQGRGNGIAWFGEKEELILV